MASVCFFSPDQSVLSPVMLPCCTRRSSICSSMVARDAEWGELPVRVVETRYRGSPAVVIEVTILAWGSPKKDPRTSDPMFPPPRGNRFGIADHAEIAYAERSLR